MRSLRPNNCRRCSLFSLVLEDFAERDVDGGAVNIILCAFFEERMAETLLLVAHLVQLLADSRGETKGERMKAVKSTAEISDPPPLDFICSVDEDRMH